MTSEVISTVADSDVAKQRELVEYLFAGYPNTAYAVRFWDGSEWRSDPGVEPSFTFVLKHKGALRRMFWPPNPMAFSVANIYDDFEIQGDMLSFCFYGRYLEDLAKRLRWWEKAKLAFRLFMLPQVEQRRIGRQAAELSGEIHSRERDRKAICYHYDTEVDPIRWARNGRFLVSFLAPRTGLAGWCRECRLPFQRGPTERRSTSRSDDDRSGDGPL